jgi:hypothetical protein
MMVVDLNCGLIKREAPKDKNAAATLTMIKILRHFHIKRISPKELNSLLFSCMSIVLLINNQKYVTLNDPK